jgi:DNA helicase HerA-like ATPase
MTGAGKSVTARRIVEELAAKHYPIVIFDSTLALLWRGWGR